MATAELLSDLVTNAEAVPQVMNDDNGSVRVLSGTLELNDSFDSGDIAALCELPAGASVKSIKLFHDALTGLSDANIGLYSGPNSTDLTDADENCYADAVDLTSASLTGTEVAFEARSVANINNKVWEDAGDSQGDFSSYYLCLTAASNVSAGYTLSFAVEYVCN